MARRANSKTNERYANVRHMESEIAVNGRRPIPSLSRASALANGGDMSDFRLKNSVLRRHYGRVMWNERNKRGKCGVK